MIFLVGHQGIAPCAPFGAGVSDRYRRLAGSWPVVWSPGIAPGRNRVVDAACSLAHSPHVGALGIEPRKCRKFIRLPATTSRTRP